MTEKEQLKFDLTLVDQNIQRAVENIDIFSAQADKHRQQKIELEMMKQELEENLAKLK